MRLLNLKVSSYQCIESAEIELGPGLNVLYGPNDHGKSSLASAIRAVLLLQHSSAAHEKLVSWHSGATPDVALSFTTEAQRFYRVRKQFGKNGMSNLEFSVDGRSYSNEASSREVDDKLRALLRWGIPKPGETKVHGLGEAFLTQVLLAEQRDVPEILARGLAADKDESGRAFLNEALAALAQDPTFKYVLDRAAGKVNKAFTPGGKLSKTKGSPLQVLGAEITELINQQKELQGKLDECQQIQSRLAVLQSERDEALVAVDRGRERLETARALWRHAQARLALAQSVAQARTEADELSTQHYH